MIHNKNYHRHAHERGVHERDSPAPRFGPSARSRSDAAKGAKNDRA